MRRAAEGTSGLGGSLLSGVLWGPESREAKRAEDELQEHWAGLPLPDTHRLLPEAITGSLHPPRGPAPLAIAHKRNEERSKEDRTRPRGQQLLLLESQPGTDCPVRVPPGPTHESPSPPPPWRGTLGRVQ